MTSNATIKRVAAEAAEAEGQPLGYVMYWSIAVGSPGVRHEDVRAALDASGLTTDYLPAPEDTERAAIRAIKRAAKDHGAEPRSVAVEPGVRIWVIVDSSVPPDATVGDSVGTIQNRVALDRINGVVRFEHDTPLAQQAVAMFEQWTSFLNGDDLRRVVVKHLTAMGGINMTRAGGAYFLFPEHADKLDALMEVIGQQGESFAYAVQLNATGRNKKSVGLAAHARLVAEIDRLQEEAKEWADGRRHLPSTLEARVQRYTELRSAIKMWCGLLTMHHDDLDQALEALHQDYQRLLTGGQTSIETVNPTADGETPPAPEQDDEPRRDDAGPPPQDAPPPPDAPPMPTPPSRPAAPSTRGDNSDDASDDPAAAAFARMTVPQLRALARKHKVNPRGMNREELIAAIEATT